MTNLTSAACADDQQLAAIRWRTLHQHQQRLAGRADSRTAEKLDVCHCQASLKALLNIVEQACIHQ